MICPEMTIIPGPPNSALENWPVNPPLLIGRETEHKDLDAERCIYFSLTNSFNYCLELPTWRELTFLQKKTSDSFGLAFHRPSEGFLSIQGISMIHFLPRPK